MEYGQEYGKVRERTHVDSDIVAPPTPLVGQIATPSQGYSTGVTPWETPSNFGSTTAGTAGIVVVD